jgi:hypothetical protein
MFQTLFTLTELESKTGLTKNCPSHLHRLAYRKSADRMKDLATLYPAIVHLGGEGAMRGVVDEMKRVCEQ